MPTELQKDLIDFKLYIIYLQIFFPYGNIMY